jgi:bifunctional NMN adenylyltransferase/nudix hydrolase
MSNVPAWADNVSAPVYDIAVVIGRFQPFHKAHKELIDTALRRAKHVLILIGSAYIARNTKNPFTYEERRDMIKNLYCSYPKISYGALVDDLYSDQQWIASVQAQVDALNVLNPRVCIVGHKKDDSSYYLDLFPKWDYIPVTAVSNCDATQIRQMLYEFKPVGDLLPTKINQYLNKWIDNNAADFQRLCLENEFLIDYRKQFASMPYPPTFVTTDAVVVNNGYVLMVKRGAHPGKGLWALPGGFINQKERIVDCMIRELIEETRIKIDHRILRANIKNVQVFDAPDRSLRGRTITHAGLIVLNEPKLPAVRGSDDAERAKWIPISQLYTNDMRMKMYEDHWSIASYMINRVG